MANKHSDIFQGQTVGGGANLLTLPFQ